MAGLKKLKTAVIGVGNMGKYHARNYFEIERSNLLAISDLNEALGEELADKYKCKYYPDYLEMLRIEKLDAVTIAVPSKYHFEVGQNVLKRGVHSLIEKPIAMTKEEGEALIKTAKNSKVKLMVGHIERFNPGVIKLKEIISSGKLGEIISIIARRVGVFPPQIKDANVIIDLAVHDIDIINYFFDKEPDQIIANGGRAITQNREDYAELFLTYGDATGFIQVNWITPVKIRSIAVTGSKGYAELNYITQKLQLFSSRFTKAEDTFGDFVIKFSEPEKIDIDVEQKEPLKAELESFLEAVASDKEPKTPGEAGLRALNIALEAIKSINNEEHKSPSHSRN